MEALRFVDSLADGALLVALASTRFAVAFLLLPIFASETVPALVRNALFVGLGLITLAVQPAVPVQGWTAGHWLLLFGRESLLGIGLGVLLGAVLWAFEAAGQIVDAKVGATLAQVADPLSGHQTSLSGALLARLAMFLFMAGGGFLALVAVAVQSFAIWPLAQPGLHFDPADVQVFESAFAQLMLLALLFAAPALVVLYVLDLALGLVNRFAPQLNLISISMSLKSVAATLVWVLMFTVLVDTVVARLDDGVAGLLPALRIWAP